MDAVVSGGTNRMMLVPFSGVLVNDNTESHSIGDVSTFVEYIGATTPVGL